MFYLARWTSYDDLGTTALRPDMPDDVSWSALDFRGITDRLTFKDWRDASSPAWALVYAEDYVTARPGRLIRVGDDKDDISEAAMRVLRNRLGWAGARAGRSIGQLALDFYIEEADDAVDGRPNRLLPTKLKRGGPKRIGIRLGPQILDSMPVPSDLSASYSDNFNRSNGAIGADWTQTDSGTGSVSVDSNEAQNANDFAITYYAYDANTSSTDSQFCELTATSEIDNNAQFGPQVRMLNSYANSSGYMAHWQPNNNQARIRYTNTSGIPARTDITSYTGRTETAPVDVRIEVDGSGLEYFLDGSSIGSTTDTTYGASSTRRSGGFFVYAPNETFDDWAFGDLSTLYTGSAQLAGAGAIQSATGTRTRDLGSGTISSTSTQTGAVSVVKTLTLDDVTTAVSATASLDVVVNMSGTAVDTLVTPTGDIDVLPSELSGDITSSATLSGSITAVREMSGNDIAATTSLTGKMEAQILGGDISTDTTVSTASLTRVATIAGDVTSGANLIFGPPITYARMWDGTQWVEAWVTVYDAGEWKRGQLRIWNGSTWQG